MGDTKNKGIYKQNNTDHERGDEQESRVLIGTFNACTLALSPSHNIPFRQGIVQSNPWYHKNDKPALRINNELLKGEKRDLTLGLKPWQLEPPLCVNKPCAAGSGSLLAPWLVGSGVSI